MDTFKILLDAECVQLVVRNGVYAVADEASGFNLENGDVYFCTSFNMAYEVWTGWVKAKTVLKIGECG